MLSHDPLTRGGTLTTVGQRILPVGIASRNHLGTTMVWREKWPGLGIYRDFWEVVNGPAGQVSEKMKRSETKSPWGKHMEGPKVVDTQWPVSVPTREDPLQWRPYTTRQHMAGPVGTLSVSPWGHSEAKWVQGDVMEDPMVMNQKL